MKSRTFIYSSAQFSSVAVMSDSLQPHGLQHTRVTDHALITWLSCTDHETDHALIRSISCTDHMTAHALITWMIIH